MLLLLLLLLLRGLLLLLLLGRGVGVVNLRRLRLLEVLRGQHLPLLLLQGGSSRGSSTSLGRLYLLSELLRLLLGGRGYTNSLLLAGGRRAGQQGRALLLLQLLLSSGLVPLLQRLVLGGGL